MSIYILNIVWFLNLFQFLTSHSHNFFNLQILSSAFLNVSIRIVLTLQYCCRYYLQASGYLSGCLWPVLIYVFLSDALECRMCNPTAGYLIVAQFMSVWPFWQRLRYAQDWLTHVTCEQSLLLNILNNDLRSKLFVGFFPKHFFELRL